MDIKGFLRGLVVADVAAKQETVVEETENKIIPDEPLSKEAEDAIKCKMYALWRKLPAFDYSHHTMFNHDEDMRLYELVNDIEHNLCIKSNYALDLEKADLEQSLILYQAMVDEEFSHNAIPYVRLAINYRKEKRYDDEIDVLKKGILALPKSERYKHAEELLDRLEKAIVLREKSKIK